jgi:hypothetical protein
MFEPMRKARAGGAKALGALLLSVWCAPSPAQGDTPPPQKPAGSDKPAPTAPFVDRDGDGVNDEMQHRFRRHKRGHGKRHGDGKSRKAQHRQQGGSPE